MATTGGRYDAIVIGASLDGLAAATTLAQANQRVVVLDRREVAGGVAADDEPWPGYRVPGPLGDAWISPALARELGLSGVGYSAATPVSVTSLLGNGASFMMSPDVGATQTVLRAHSVRDAEQWPAFAARVQRLAAFLEHLYSAPPPRVDATSIAELIALAGTGRRLRALGKQDMLELLRTLPMSVADLLDDTFEADALKGVLGAIAVAHVPHGPRSGATAFTLLHHLVGKPAGALRMSSGAAALARAMAETAKARGVEIRLGAEVARITTAGNAVSAVTLADGSEISASRVISSLSARQTLLELGDPSRLDPEIVRAIRHVRYRGVVSRVDFALEGLPNFSGLADELALRGALLVAPDLRYLERAYDATKYGRVSERPALEIRIPSLNDPAAAPSGKHVMSVRVQYTPYALRDGSTALAWDDARRNALADTVTKLIAEHAPGFESLVGARRVLAPPDLEARYGAPEGNVLGSELALDQILFMRPVPQCNRYRTPIKGLVLCGSDTHPGGGIVGRSGVLAAKAL